MSELVLSIIVPSYNTFRFLDKYASFYCSEKIKGKFEILLIDDGSTDGQTPAALDEICGKYPEFFKVVHKENGGHGSTINTGVKIAKGKYFRVIDGDDEIDTKNLEQMIEDLEKADADVVVSDYEFLYDATSTSEYVKSFKGGDEQDLDNYVLQIHSMSFLTKIWIENNIKLREKAFYEDQEYVIFPIPFLKKIKYLPYSCYKYHLGVEGQSMSLDGRRKHQGDSFAVAEDLIEYHKKYFNVGEQKKAFTNIIAFAMSRMFETIILLAHPNSPKKELKDFLKKLKDQDVALYKATKKEKLVKVSSLCGFLFVNVFAKMFYKRRYNK